MTTMNKIKRCPFKVTVKCLSSGLLRCTPFGEQVHTIFILKLLSSETKEAMRENKGNYFFRKKIEPSFMSQ